MAFGEVYNSLNHISQNKLPDSYDKREPGFNMAFKRFRILPPHFADQPPAEIFSRRKFLNFFVTKMQGLQVSVLLFNRSVAARSICLQ